MSCLEVLNSPLKLHVCVCLRVFQTSVWVFEKNAQKKKKKVAPVCFSEKFFRKQTVIYEEKPSSSQNVQLDEVTLSWRVKPPGGPRKRRHADTFSHGATFVVQRQDRQTASWEKGVLVARPSAAESEGDDGAV